MNNIPSFLQRDDFMARHSDMVDAARGEPLTKEQIELRRMPSNQLWGKFFKSMQQHSLLVQAAASCRDAKIGTTLRIRLPSDYKVG